jgi:opacity protein-like surface antigen
MQAMVGIAPANGIISVRFDGQYGSVKYENPTGQTKAPKDKIFALHGDLVLHPRVKGGVRPYILAGPSYGHFSFRASTTPLGDESTSNFGFNGGAGLNLGTGDKVWFFLEGRYVYTKEHKYIPVTLGVRINTSQPFNKK